MYKRSGIEEALGGGLLITPIVAAEKASVTVFLTQSTVLGGLVIPVFETSTLPVEASSTEASSAATSASSKPTSSASQTSSSASSSAKSSSSSSSSSSQSSSATSSSASRSSGSSSASSTSQSSSTISSAPGSSNSATPTATLFSSATTPSASASTAADSNAAVGASSKQSGLSTGAIIGIVAGGAALLIVILIFIIRKRCLRRRQKRRATWAIDNFATTDLADLREKSEPEPEPVARPPSFISSVRSVPRTGTPMGQQRVSPPSQTQMGQQQPQQYSPYPAMQRPMQQPQGQMRAAPPPTVPFVPLPAAPPTTYNNPSQPAPPSQYYPAAPAFTLSVNPAAGGAFALVCTTFVPRMSDELSVNGGEMVRILEEFDDGWARCTNLRGEVGVVPLECLQRQDQSRPSAGYAPAQMASQGQGDWRNMQRSGSLRAGQNGRM